MTKMYVETLRERRGTGKRINDSYFGDDLMIPDALCCHQRVYAYIDENPEQELGVLLSCEKGHPITLKMGRSKLTSGEQALWVRA